MSLSSCKSVKSRYTSNYPDFAFNPASTIPPNQLHPSIHSKLAPLALELRLSPHPASHILILPNQNKHTYSHHTHNPRKPSSLNNSRAPVIHSRDKKITRISLPFLRTRLAIAISPLSLSLPPSRRERWRSISTRATARLYSTTTPPAGANLSSVYIHTYTRERERERERKRKRRIAADAPRTFAFRSEKSGLKIYGAQLAGRETIVDSRYRFVFTYFRAWSAFCRTYVRVCSALCFKLRTLIERVFFLLLLHRKLSPLAREKIWNLSRAERAKSET